MNTYPYHFPSLFFPRIYSPAPLIRPRRETGDKCTDSDEGRKEGRKLGKLESGEGGREEEGGLE